MATQPTHPPPKPPSPPPALKPQEPPKAPSPAHPNPKPSDHDYDRDPQAAKVEGYQAVPEPLVKTVADEQRERSEEIQKQGVDAWKAAHDERSPEERQGRQVPGVGHVTDESKLKGNSTPEARTAQHPAAPR